MARRRRNLKDMLTPDPTPDKQLTHPSGWCMTNSHEGCKYQFNHGKCGCSCHTQKTQKTRKAVAGIAPRHIIVDEVAPDPRPWKRS